MTDLRIPSGFLAALRAKNVWTAPRARVLVAPVVAAELRRLAEAERPSPPIDPSCPEEAAYIEARNEVCANLLRRASELDPLGSAGKP